VIDRAAIYWTYTMTLCVWAILQCNV